MDADLYSAARNHPPSQPAVVKYGNIYMLKREKDLVYEQTVFTADTGLREPSGGLPDRHLMIVD